MCVFGNWPSFGAMLSCSPDWEDAMQSALNVDLELSIDGELGTKCLQGIGLWDALCFF